VCTLCVFCIEILFFNIVLGRLPNTDPRYKFMSTPLDNQKIIVNYLPPEIDDRGLKVYFFMCMFVLVRESYSRYVRHYSRSLEKLYKLKSSVSMRQKRVWGLDL